MGEVTKGKYSYGDVNRRGLGNSINIGKFCSIAENVIFDGGMSHNPRLVTTFPFNCVWPGLNHLKGHPVIKGDINIGNDVYIGMSSIIMSGVTIGSGAVIGANTIVTKDVEPYTVVVGAPMKVVRKRFTHFQIESLLSLKWWDWDDDKITKNAHLLMSEDIETLLNEHIWKL